MTSTSRAPQASMLLVKSLLFFYYFYFLTWNILKKEPRVNRRKAAATATFLFLTHSLDYRAACFFFLARREDLECVVRLPPKKNTLSSPMKMYVTTIKGNHQSRYKTDMMSWWHTTNPGEGKTPGGVDRPGWIDLAFNFDVILYTTQSFFFKYKYSRGDISTEGRNLSYMNPLEGFPLFLLFWVLFVRYTLMPFHGSIMQATLEMYA